jgi:hypothetical protein
MAIAALLSFLLLAGCAGESKPEAGSAQPAIMPSAPKQPVGTAQPPAAPSEEPSNPQPEGAHEWQRPQYVNYCYETYWRGTLSGSAHNDFATDGCGTYDYSATIDATFALPYDLEAYMNGTDFNFADCPGVEGDKSARGRFNSTRQITSEVEGMVDRRPDNTVTSNGVLYAWLSRGGLALATYPQEDWKAALAGGKYPHIVAGRCTWENGIQTYGNDSVLLYSSSASSLQGSRGIAGRWGIGSMEMGSFALYRAG